jgi:hypothetical protein
MGNKSVHIIGGGTVSHIRPHLALCAPAYGTTARRLMELCQQHSDRLDVSCHLTRMADSTSRLETNDDIAVLIDQLVSLPSTKIIFFNAAIVDFDATSIDHSGGVGKHLDRLRTVNGERTLTIRPTEKLLRAIRQDRKDIFLVSTKTTAGASEDEQFKAGLCLLKQSSSNLVLANDIRTRTNMIITPEEARYHTTHDREVALRHLVEMAYLRSHLTFTRSTVIAGDPVSWSDDRVPPALRAVVDHCIRRGAYKPFMGATVGHFACKLDDTTFLTSRRKTDFNQLTDVGLVLVKTDGPDSVIAYGSRPSVGGQSQRIVFHDHPDIDCIVHFHCPKRSGSPVPSVSQREFECGSHECGRNTSQGLRRFGNLRAVHLDHHGPNIGFSRSVDPNEVISFIEANFDLTAKTDGYEG